MTLLNLIFYFCFSDKKIPFLTKLLINLEPIILVITTNNDVDDDNSDDDKICIFIDFFILIVFKSQQLMNSLFFVINLLRYNNNINIYAGYYRINAFVYIYTAL